MRSFAWREMLTSFKRRPWLMLGWTAVLSCCLMALGWIQGFAEGAARASAELRPAEQVWVFAHHQADEVALESLLSRLRSLPSVDELRRLSQEEVRGRIGRELASAGAAEELPDDLLPRAILLLPAAGGISDAAVEILRAADEVDWVDLGDQQQLQAQQRVRILSRSAQGLGLLLVLTLLLLGLGLGRLAMSLKRDEVAIMRLVGGTQGWIAAPMLLSAVVIASVAALLAFVGCQLAMGGLHELSEGGLRLIAPVPALPLFLRLLGMALASQVLGVLLGVSSALSRSEMAPP